MSSVATQMDLEITTLSQSGGERKISYDIPHLKFFFNYINELFIKQKQTYRYRKQTYGYQTGNMEGRDESVTCNEHTHTTTMDKVDNQQGPTVQHRERYSIFCNDLQKNLKK